MWIDSWDCPSTQIFFFLIKVWSVDQTPVSLLTSNSTQHLYYDKNESNLNSTILKNLELSNLTSEQIIRSALENHQLYLRISCSINYLIELIQYMFQSQKEIIHQNNIVVLCHLQVLSCHRF